jgi:hypothetical protein
LIRKAMKLLPFLRGKAIRPLTKTQAAYIAGIIDGEGSITICRRTNPAGVHGMKRGCYHRLLLTTNMTHKKTIVWLRAATGLGSVYPARNASQKNHKPSWKWDVWSREALQVLKAVKPYLITKTRQADAAIAFQTPKYRSRGNLGLSDAQWQVQVDAYFELRKLNRRGQHVA